jgi:dihydroorotate dehydrogenase
MTAALAALYRVFYDGILSRLPESRAVAIGQSALRVVPFDRLPAFRIDDERLATTVGGIRLANPLILAAQYYDVTILRRAMGLGFGAVTAKSITRNPRPGHPEPNLVRVRTAAGPGLVNCNGFKNPGLDAFAREIARLPHRVPLIVSVAGETPEDCVALVRGLAPYGDLVEFNISSPNTRLVYAWSERPAELRALLEQVRAACPRPLIVKISPDFADANERDIIPAALEAGARVINYGNTRRVDDPRLSQGVGGLSGPELFPATLANVRRTRARFGAAFDLIATGGIDAPDKARALLDAGATALGYFTGFITRGPLLARQILDELRAARTGAP